MDEATGSTHELLLALAGRLDDDMLASARELVAVGEDTRAIALVAAALAADAAALPAPLRAALVDAARAARIDLDADAALPAATTAGPEHRFAAAPASGDDRVARAVAALPARLLDGAEVLLTWRLTPAGGAPGPLPHPVLLVEVEPANRPADVLAYQISVGLDRAGVVASVEVLTTGRPLSDYHAAARREARRVDGSAAGPPATTPPPVPSPEPEPDVAEPPVARSAPAAPVRPEPVPLFGVSDPPADPDATATDPAGDVLTDTTARSLPRRAARGADPEPQPASRPLDRLRTTVTPLARAVPPSPGPLTRRDGSGPRPDSAPEIAAYPSAERGQVPALADTPTFRSMQDPLSGPLNAPLLAPLLDPTPPDETDLVHGGGDDPFGPGGISPLAPDRPHPASVEDLWADEWASGDWAVTPQDLRPDDGADPEQPQPRSTDEPRPEAAQPPRHRVSFAPPVEPPPAAPQPPSAPDPSAPGNPMPTEPRPDRPAPVRPPAAKQTEPVGEEPAVDGLGLRPDSVARLSAADRELLARLQTELGTGPRPPTSRRAEATPPRRNGHGRLDPPDLAG